MIKHKVILNWGLIALITLSTILSIGSEVNQNLLKNNNLVLNEISVEAYSNGNYKVNTRSGVKVRSGAGTGYSRRGASPNGTSFTVSSISGNWGYTSSIRCTNGYRSGWVCLSYCRYISSGSSSSSNSSGKSGYGTVKASALNVRTGPGTNYRRKTSIRYGTRVYISFTSGNWGYDTTHGGYVSLSYINFSGSGGGNSSGGGSSVPSSSNYISLAGGRAYCFVPKCAGGKCLDVAGWGTNNGTNIQLYEYNGTASQQWRVIYAGKYSGKCYYYIQSKLNSNYYLDISGGNNYNGCNVQLYYGNSSDAQKYALYYKTYNGGGSSGGNSSGTNNSSKGTNLNAAIAYADRYCKNYNPNYPSYKGKGGDCANFVSQCLHAGGIPTDGTWRAGYSSWTTCTGLRNYFHSKYGVRFYETTSKSGINPGDVVYMKGTSGYLRHVVFCVAVNGRTVYVDAHTSDRYRMDSFSVQGVLKTSDLF